MAEKNLFARCAELLLEKKVICYFSHPRLFAYLQDTANLDALNQFLSQLERRAVRSSDGAGIYCVYTAAHDDPEALNEIRKQFEQDELLFRPLVNFLHLIRTLEDRGRPLTAGDEVRESELLGALEHFPNLGEQLKDIARGFGYKKSDTDGRTMLRHVLNYLADEGYLVKQPGSSGSVFRATARWSVLYDELEFLAGVAGTGSVEPAQADPVQTELF